MTLTIIGASKELRAFPRCRNGHSFSSKSKRWQGGETAQSQQTQTLAVKCGRDIAILHEENKNAGCLG